MLFPFDGGKFFIALKSLPLPLGDKYGFSPVAPAPPARPSKLPANVASTL